MTDNTDGPDDFDKALANLDANIPEGRPPWTVVPSKAYGDAELAADIAIMLSGRVTVTDAMSFIRQYGPLKVQLAAKRLGKLDLSGIENLGVALRLAIVNGHIDDFDKKMAPLGQKQPSSYIDPLGESSDNSDQGASPLSADDGQLSEILKLRKAAHWTIPENRQWYLRLPMNIRAIVVSDALYKWPYLDRYAEQAGLDMLSNECAHARFFGVHMSRVINSIRFDNISRPIRSKIDPGDIGEVE